MASRAAWIGSTAALSASMVVGLGLGTASADRREPCGAVTARSACESGGALRAGIYQRPFTIPSAGATQPIRVLCKGGKSLEDLDTALADNFLQYLVAFTSLSPDTAVSRVVDSDGRLVGYSFVGDAPIGEVDLPFFLTCVDDR